MFICQPATNNRMDFVIFGLKFKPMAYTQLQYKYTIIRVCIAIHRNEMCRAYNNIGDRTVLGTKLFIHSQWDVFYAFEANCLTKWSTKL